MYSQNLTMQSRFPMCRQRPLKKVIDYCKKHVVDKGDDDATLESWDAVFVKVHPANDRDVKGWLDLTCHDTG